MHIWLSHPQPGLVPLKAARVSPLDRGLLLGDGLFETLRLVGGRAPLLSWHLERLVDGCARLGFPTPAGELVGERTGGQAGERTAGLATGLAAGLAAALAALAAANGVSAGGFARITLTRGPGERGYAPPQRSEPWLMIQAGPWPSLAGTGGRRLALAPWPQPAHPVLSQVKHTSRLLQVLGSDEARRLGVDDLLWCDGAGRLAEATASNLFWVRHKQVYTPHFDTGCLPGVARRWVVARLPVAQVSAVPATLATADEVFLTNALTGPVPVSEVSGVGVWAAPGSITAGLQAAWAAQFAAG